MNLKRLCVLYFSPTGGTERIARFAVGELAGRLGLEPEFIDFTRPEARQAEYRFAPDDLLVMASPVYAGRLPNKLMPEYKARIFGSRTPAIPICVFGNRSPDEALRELVLLLEDNGFQIAAGAAFAGRHAFSDRVGGGRPDGEDLAQIAAFAAHAAEKLAGDALPLLEMDRSEIGPYYVPRKEDGSPAKFLKAKPLTRWERCSRCGACARACPIGSIDPATMEAVGLCIKCQACVRRCTVQAKYFEDADFLSHVAMLEQTFTRRAEHVILL
jgi:ferredoxin/flavodoxin